MTLYHFMNCLLLTFGPPVILYKFSILSEYGTIWRPMVGALGYIVTQISKILLIAGLVNLSPFWEHIIDLMGMYYFLVHHQKASLASVKILNMALGWSVAESIFTRLVNFYINARSLQFNWQHLMTSSESNLSLIQNICFCTLLWHWNRKNSKTYPSVLLAYIVFISFLNPGLTTTIVTLLAFSAFTLLISN